MKRAFGNILQELRKQAELTQVDLAQKSGLSQAAISRLERGNRWPVFRTLNVLSEALNIDLGKLLKQTGDEIDKPEAKNWKSSDADKEENEN